MVNKQDVIDFFKNKHHYRLLSNIDFDIDYYIMCKNASENVTNDNKWYAESYNNRKELFDSIIDLGLTTSECVHEWGGEGEGTSIGRVHYFPEVDLYLSIEGYYQSHYGSDWDESPDEVRPTQKTITVYK